MDEHYIYKCGHFGTGERIFRSVRNGNITELKAIYKKYGENMKEMWWKEGIHGDVVVDLLYLACNVRCIVSIEFMAKRGFLDRRIECNRHNDIISLLLNPLHKILLDDRQQFEIVYILKLLMVNGMKIGHNDCRHGCIYLNRRETHIYLAPLLMKVLLKMGMDPSQRCCERPFVDPNKCFGTIFMQGSGHYRKFKPYEYQMNFRPIKRYMKWSLDSKKEATLFEMLLPVLHGKTYRNVKITQFFKNLQKPINKKRRIY